MIKSIFAATNVSELWSILINLGRATGKYGKPCDALRILSDVSWNTVPRGYIFLKGFEKKSRYMINTGQC